MHRRMLSVLVIEFAVPRFEVWAAYMPRRPQIPVVEGTRLMPIFCEQEFGE